MSYTGNGFAGRRISGIGFIDEAYDRNFSSSESKPSEQADSRSIDLKGWEQGTPPKIWHDDPKRSDYEYCCISNGRKIFRRKTDAEKKKNSTPKSSKYKGKRSWESNHEWCEETKDYRNKDVVVKIKGIGTRLLRPGRGHILYCLYPYRGMTAVRLYDKKSKRLLSKFIFNGEISADDARIAIFDGARTVKQARKKGVRKPFKVVYRHNILTKDDFDKDFVPNTYNASTYKTSKKDNKVLKSLSNIINKSSGNELSFGTPAAALNACERIFKTERYKYTGDFPCVEVFAIWINFDPETNILHKDYDAWEPLQYCYNLFHNRHEMLSCPL